MREPVQPTPRRAMTPKRRLEALLRSEGRCALCKVKLGEAFEVDHTITLFLGGADDESNTLALCVPCHRGVKTPADAKVHAQGQEADRPSGRLQAPAPADLIARL